jgi:MFS family permease
MQMNTVAQGWLVYKLTGSGFALGLVGAGGSIATLVLSLYGGVLSDRFEKRQILLWTRAAMVLSSLTLGILISTGAIQVWHIAAGAMVQGILFALMMPAQNAIMSDIVGRDLLMNAISLSSVGMGLMGIIAASFAGFMIEAVGVETVYFGNALLYVGALFTISRLPLTGVSDTTRNSVWQDLGHGVRYLWGREALMGLLALALVRVLFAMPYSTLMPKYARDVLNFDARGLGLLSAAPGVGGMISALALAALGDYRGKGRLLLAAGLLMGAFLVIFGSSKSVAIAVLALAVVGYANNSCMVSNQALLQTNCIDRFRGRVLSVYMMTWGLTPLGTLPAGALADRWGVPAVLIAQGAITALAFAAIWVFKPTIRSMD